MATYTLLVENAYVERLGRTVDIGIEGDTIVRVGDVDGTADRVVDAAGNLVGPGFAECHLHVDKAFAAYGARRPRGHEEPFSFDRIADLEAEYFAAASVEDIERNAVRNVEMAVAAGSTCLRSHIGISGESGLKRMEAVVRAREATSDIADLQLVVTAGDVREADAAARAREAIEMGLDAGGGGAGAFDEPVLVGGVDPATAHDDVEGVLPAWFELAREYDVGIDLHVHDGGTLGTYTLERLVEFARRFDYHGRVTASHCYCLSNVPEWRQDELVETLGEVGMSVVTCYQSTRPEMPVRKLLTEGDRKGVTLGHGTDNDRDFVFPHGNADMLEGALVQSNKLHGDRTFVEDYRWYDTDEGLGALWEMLTHNGARVLGIGDRYGVEEGTPANLVVFDSPSPQWAIITQAERTHVIKDGTVVAEDGDLTPEHTVVGGHDDVLEPPIRDRPSGAEDGTE
jgi:cytosine/adenosine deaminase-related metal-dependent hydrolase